MLNRMLIGTFSKMAFEKFPRRSKQLATRLSQRNTLEETVLAKAERRGQDPYVLGAAREQCGKQERRTRMSLLESINAASRSRRGLSHLDST